jgi:poly(3-hydroxybutyrate) depolymerase
MATLVMSAPTASGCGARARLPHFLEEEIMHCQRRLLWVSIIGLLATLATCNDARSGESPADRAEVERGLKDLQERLAGLRPRAGAMDTWADAQLFAKAVAWGLYYQDQLGAGDLALARKALERGQQRAEALAAGKKPWAAKQGRVVRGFVSPVDGSVQLYGLVVPARPEGAVPARLDVVLHGSIRSDALSELRFIKQWDVGDQDGATADGDVIELHPLGRVGESAFRFAGETDVFAAIDAVARNYKIDPDRIVLRGMSLGGVATWMLGLKQPDRFSALGPYAGPADTLVFSHAGLAHFRKIEALEPYQERTLRLVDAIDYVANAGTVPVVAAVGKKDPYYLSHLLVKQVAAREGVTITDLISPDSGHAVDPALHRQQLRLLGEHAARGINHAPRRLRLVTWTLRYARCHWIEVVGLEEHYARTELQARLAHDGSVAVAPPRNVTRFALHPPALRGAAATLTIGDTTVALPPAAGDRRTPLVIARRKGCWECLGELGAVKLDGKRPGLQGPIDDAFTGPFLCVRGTGKPWDTAVGAWAEASLRRFAHEWRRHYRGELPVKDDKDVSADDVRRHHLVLFGDPGSNVWIAMALPKLPLGWTREEVSLGGVTYPSAGHAPLLIAPNPLPGGEGRYLVLNSGHTFHEAEGAYRLSYLIYPRLGDWAVLRVGAKQPRDAAAALDEAVLNSGFFNEGWGVADHGRPGGG